MKQGRELLTMHRGTATAFTAKDAKSAKKAQAFFFKDQPLPSFAFFASFAVQVFAPQSTNGKATALTAKDAKSAKHSQAFSFQETVFAFFASFAVEVFAFAFAVYSAFRIPHSAFSVRKCSCKNATYVFRPPKNPLFGPKFSTKRPWR
jgi:hypothetical protein